MARPIWNGAISFGLLNVPVQLYSAERSADEVHFHLLDSRDRSPIRYERLNAETGKPVEWQNIVKAFEYQKGHYVVIEDQQIRAAAPEATETVQVEAFVDRTAIGPVYFERPYYLVPRKKAEKGYVLLRETLERTGRIGIGKVVIRTHQYLAALMPQGNALILDLMRFPQQLVPAEQFELPSRQLADYHVSPRELAMAAQLIDSMTTAWRPDDYRDDFTDKLHQIIEQRIAQQNGKVVEAPKPARRQAATNVVDFMALLKRSLENKGARGKRPEAPAPTRSAASGSPAGRPHATRSRNSPKGARHRHRASSARVVG